MESLLLDCPQGEHEGHHVAFPLIFQPPPSILPLFHIGEAVPATKRKLVQELDGEVLRNEWIQDVSQAMVPTIFCLVDKCNIWVGIRMLFLKLQCLR